MSDGADRGGKQLGRIYTAVLLLALAVLLLAANLYTTQL